MVVFFQIDPLVYWMPDGSVQKAVDASHYEGDVEKLLDKIVLHNSMFPETSYKVLGFGRDRGGTFRIILKQPYVKGTRGVKGISIFVLWCIPIRLCVPVLGV